MSTIPPPRLVITTHTATGKSTVLSDNRVELTYPFGPGRAGFATLDGLVNLPASNDPSTEPEIKRDLSIFEKNGIARPPPITTINPTSTGGGEGARNTSGGVTFSTSDFAPGSSARLHRTLSVDYTIVMAGEIVMELEDGEEVLLKAGDCVVQKGTLHNWHNRSETEWARMGFVMVAAKEVVLPSGEVVNEGLF